MSKSLHISKIQDGLDEMRKISQKSDTFDIQGHSITIRTLSHEEKKRAEARQSNSLKEALQSNNPIKVNQWTDQMKVDILSYAIIGLNDTDLEGVSYIQTDEKDQNGNFKRKEKHIFMREVVNQWNDTLIDVCFKKFRELNQESQSSLEDEVDFEDQSLDEKIEQKEAELEKLRGMKEESEEGTKSEPDHETETLSQDQLKEEIFSPMSDEEAEERARKEVAEFDLAEPDQEESSTSEQTPAQGRQRLNEQPMNMNQGDLPNESQEPSPQPQRTQQRETPDVPISDGFSSEPENIDHPDDIVPNEDAARDPVTNPEPEGSINPNYDPQN